MSTPDLEEKNEPIRADHIVNLLNQLMQHEEETLDYLEFCIEETKGTPYEAFFTDLFQLERKTQGQVKDKFNEARLS